MQRASTSFSKEHGNLRASETYVLYIRENIMSIETNIEEIKKNCKVLLNMPLDPAEFNDVFLSHPNFESTICAYKEEGGGLSLIDIREKENFDKLVSQWEGFIDKTDKVLGLFMGIRKPYMLFLFYVSENYLSEKDYADMLSFVWVDSENPNGDVNVPISQSAEFFKKANKKYLMEPEDYEHYVNLPDEFTVYRGVAKGRVKDGLSWTENLEKARWFANRWQSNGYIQKATVNKKDVLAYFNTRDEDEIVVSPKDLQNIEVI